MTNILGIQIIGVLFALLMIYLTFLHSRRKEFTGKETLFWMCAWGVFLILTVLPTSFDFLIKGWLNMGRRLDFYIVVGFTFLIGLIFHIYSVIRKTQNKIERIVRKIAIEKNSEKK